MEWVRGERLGCGSFAQVSLAVSKNQGSSAPPLVAVKSCGVSLSSTLMNEKAVLDELRGCPEVIHCYGESFSCENGERLYNVLLEYASGGSLADKLKLSGDGRLQELETRQYIKAVLEGLRYIHSSGYVHCDIKLQNILLFSDGGVKIADFGLAKKVEGCGGRPELRGTPMYMSPEIASSGEQGPPADVWALGCMVAEMVSGSPAWSCSDVATLLLRIGVGEEVPAIPESLSEEGKDFMLKCFIKDPKERWTAEMLLNHPFVHHQNSFKEREESESRVSTSPRCPFEFEDWDSIISLPLPAAKTDFCFSEESNSTQSSCSVSPAERLRCLQNDDRLEWSFPDDWITVR